MTEWKCGWLTLAAYLFVAGFATMLCMGYRPIDPPRPFMGGPITGYQIHLALSVAACLCIAAELGRMILADTKSDREDHD